MRKLILPVAVLTITLVIRQSGADTGLPSVANPLLDDGDVAADTAGAFFFEQIAPEVTDPVLPDPLLNAELRDAQTAPFLEPDVPVPPLVLPP